MNVRTPENASIAFARQVMERLNQRHPWNHNEHFHGWILRNLPDRRRHALDVGCGTGVLVETLARSFTQVTGVDADSGMVEAARRRIATNTRASVHRSDVADFAPAAEEGAFDLITMVAVLHHLDLDATLERIPGLLAPGGRLLVVGLARVDSPTDWMIDLVSVALNPLVGLIKHPRAVRRPSSPARPAPVGPVMPIRDATLTLADVGTAATAALPGCSLRRRLFFRYTLRWDKPLS